MNINELIDAIDLALAEADNFVNKYCHGDDEPVINTKKALFLLKNEIKRNSGSINERVLRAMHDIGATSVKSYENTPLEEATLPKLLSAMKRNCIVINDSFVSGNVNVNFSTTGILNNIIEPIV